MNSMNGKGVTLRLFDFTHVPDPWGREQGRRTFLELLDAVERHAGTTVFRISHEGVNQVDISFAAETVVGLAKRFRGDKGFCLADVTDESVLENWDAAALKHDQPLLVWNKERYQLLGPQPTKGTADALEFALKREEVTATELAKRLKLQLTNASMKLKQLWEQGFLLRQQAVAASGGIEFVYFRIV
jgi:hypothetical protein